MLLLFSSQQAVDSFAVTRLTGRLPESTRWSSSQYNHRPTISRYRGDDWTIRAIIESLDEDNVATPFDLTGSSIRSSIKTWTGTTGGGEITIAVPKATTAAFRPGQYLGDIEVTLTSLQVQTALTFIILVKPDTSIWMIVGTEVSSHETPGATGIVTRRIDDDDGVALMVSWTLCDGRTVLLWHKQDALMPGSQKDQDDSPYMDTASADTVVS